MRTSRDVRVCLVVFLALTACAAQRVVAPQGMHAGSDAPADFGNVTLCLRKVSVSGASADDVQDGMGSLRGGLVTYARRLGRFKDVVDLEAPGAKSPPPTLIVDLDFVVEHSSYRTYILDILFFYPFVGYWPISPQWGDARVRVTAFAYGADGAELWRGEHEASAPYSMIFYTWYRTEPIEDAYGEAYAGALAGVLAALGKARDPIAAALGVGTPRIATATALPPPPASPGVPPTAGTREKLAVLPPQVDSTASEQLPALFDDYVLSASQNVGRFDVIGQADINAMIGFERQKELAGCDEIACFAEIGGALGADLLLVVRVARVGEDWAATAKLINIRSVRVESRTSKLVSGDVRALLEAMPALVGDLVARRKPSPTGT